jgi:serine/threonine protein kinase
VSNPLTTTVKLPLPDQVIGGRYKLVRSLGQGGMGLVFLAEQLGVGNLVAVKFLDPEPTTDDTRVARFLREARVGLEVKHPGAAQVLDLGRDESLRLFLVFEYVEGQDLRELLRTESRLSFAEARGIALKVAEVLAFAHERGIVHRDIKPENIRVRRDLAGAHVKVLDFGIARLVKDAGVRLTAEGSLAGTPRYMSPEQVKDGPLDARTDVYALGLVLFEMLAGAAAFGGKNVSQVLLKQLQDPLPSLADVDPQLRFPAVDAFLRTACAKSPAQRFQTMADFVRALLALEVDAKAWPAPRTPPSTPHDSQAPTRDGKAQDVSDTLIRAEGKTESATPAPAIDPRQAARTDEAWRVESASDVGRAKDEDAVPPRGDGAGTTVDTKKPLPLIEPPGADVRSAPTRLSRAHGDLTATVRGGADAPAPARRPRRWPWAVLPALALVAALAWWFLHRG